MSIDLNPAIGKLDSGSLCYSIYSQLYQNFFNAQDSGTVIEGDITSVRLHNTAYSFAYAIAESVAGEGESGESGGILLNYLKKSGDNMAGLLRANYGFEAGIGNSRILHIKESGIDITGNLFVGGNNFFLGEKQIMCYDKAVDLVTISGTTIDIGNATLSGQGRIVLGPDEKPGIVLSPAGLLIKGFPVYHAGNANLPTINWGMRDAQVEGDLIVSGHADFSGELSALNGVRLGYKGKEVLTISPDEATLNGFLSITNNYGVKIGDTPVLKRVGETDIEFSSEYGNIHLGSENTYKIKLFAGITDIDGDNILINKYGHAYFPGSIRIAHDYGADLLSSYRIDDMDEGVILHKKLRFSTSDGIYLSGSKNILRVNHETDFAETGFRKSTSAFQMPDSNSKSLFISTSCDFITFDGPIEAKNHVGIDGSLTRLSEKHLFLSNEHYLMSVTDGIKIFGNTYLINNLSSEKFASGFAGYGWGILKNQTTGNIVATFDELNIRKKMRIYELEVQKDTTANGSLWISDSCNGDSVEKIN